jgi:hypothetical protein
VSNVGPDEFLRLAATVDPDCVRDRHLINAAADLDWALVPAAAEAHGLIPLLQFHLRRIGIDPPADARQLIAASALRHRDANRMHFEALEELLNAFDRASIPVIVLKGAALAHVLYPSNVLRPLGDLDLLVARRDAERAQAVLAAHDFVASSGQGGRRLIGHHHLPAMTRRAGPHFVQVEVHVDGVSRDAPGSLTTETLRSAPRPFSLGHRTARTLDHGDMLYHLCRHAAERARLLRLIWVADIVGYAVRYQDEIPWAELARNDPFVLNALSLFHLVTPLPGALLQRVPPPGDRLRGVGVACKPLAEILTHGRSPSGIFREIFDPSDWWLKLYYGLGDDQSLAWHRAVAHPLQVGRWLARRAGNYARWEIRRTWRGE